MNVLHRKLVLLAAAGAPQVFIFAALNLGGSLFVAVPVMAVASYAVSVYLFVIARRVRIRWLLAWVVPFVILAPYTNLIFVDLHIKQPIFAPSRAVC